jgi:nucleoid DNA-binding protein
MRATDTSGYHKEKLGETMFNLIDLVQLKTKKKREDIEEILTAAIDSTKESVQEGNDVYWVGLCKFTWKQKAKTKKQAKEWTEYPYLAEGDKLRCVPLEELDGLNAKGKIFKIQKDEDEQIQVVELQED